MEPINIVIPVVVLLLTMCFGGVSLTKCGVEESFVLAQGQTEKSKAAEKREPAILYQEGLYLERVVGDLDAAVESYKKAVAEHSKGKYDKSEVIAAEAQFRMAICYKRLGEIEEAQTAFLKLIEDFPGQIDFVKQTEEQLTLLETKSDLTGADGVVLKHDDGTMEGKRSIGGSGHAILFKKPGKGTWYVYKVEIFGSRYGSPRPPQENFKIYICDKDMKVLNEVEKPYGTFRRGPEKWVGIDIPPTKVPDEFYVCVCFNPSQTKGVYVGYDKDVEETHSKSAIPGLHSYDTGKFDWMIRAHLSRKLVPKRVTEKPTPAKRPMRSNSSEHFSISYNVDDKYADAILKICETAREAISKSFGIELPEKIEIRVSLSDGNALQLWQNGKDKIFLTVNNERQLLPPTQSGVFNVYGFCHELAHIAMSRDFSHVYGFTKEGGAYYQGWAHYAASWVIIPYVYEKLGKDAWPQPYDYLTLRGPKNFMRELDTSDPNDIHTAAQKIFYEIKQDYGNEFLGKVLNKLNEDKIESKDFVDEFKLALVEVSGGQEILRLFVKDKGK